MRSVAGSSASTPAVHAKFLGKDAEREWPSAARDRAGRGLRAPAVLSSSCFCDPVGAISRGTGDLSPFTQPPSPPRSPPGCGPSARESGAGTPRTPLAVSPGRCRRRLDFRRRRAHLRGPENLVPGEPARPEHLYHVPRFDLSGARRFHRPHCPRVEGASFRGDLAAVEASLRLVHGIAAQEVGGSNPLIRAPPRACPARRCHHLHGYTIRGSRYDLTSKTVFV